MRIDEYFAAVSEELSRRSDLIRLGFSSHHLTAGENRERILADFLESNLPAAFGVDTGLVLSKSGEFSRQADLLIVDRINNAPLYPIEDKKLWLAESVLGLIEVKSQLSPRDIEDAVEKCRRFKALPRQFADLPAEPRIRDSLFILWGWEAPDGETLKNNIVSALREVPVSEQFDFVVVPGSVLMTSGQYRETARLGRPGTAHRAKVQQSHGGAAALEKLLQENPVEALRLNHNTLLAWLIWLTAWLRGATPRSAPLQAYLDRSAVLGDAL